jgi:hypothetical protein
MNTHIPVRAYERRKPVRPSLIDNPVHVKLRECIARNEQALDHMAAMLSACVAESIAEYGEDP